jgi:hypothetical protein
MKKVIPLVLGSVWVSLATVVNAQTIGPFRGGIFCNTWEWQSYEKVETLRCGWGGFSEYRVWTGRTCSERDSSNRIVKTFPIYYMPGSQQFVRCK